MSPLRFAALLIYTTRRMRNNPGLILGTAIGLVIAVSLAMSIALYAGAADYQLLRDELSAQQAGYVRPPFAFKFRYAGVINGAIEWQDYQNVLPFFDKSVTASIALPLQLNVHQVNSPLLRIYPVQASKTITDPQPLDFMSVGFMPDFAGHVQMVEGVLPLPQPEAGNDSLQVIVLEDRANELGLLLNQDIILRWETVAIATRPRDIAAHVVGVWRPLNANDPYWFDRPESRLRGLLTSEEGFASRVVPIVPKPVYDAVWYMVFDGSSVHIENVSGFVQTIVKTRAALSAALPKADLELSPEGVMRNYVARNQMLTILMYVFAIPIVLIVLYFIVFLSNLVVYRQRNEIAVLRSRGASQVQIIGIFTLERLLIGVAALAIGVGAAQVAAQVMGSVRSFLVFAPHSQLTIYMSRQVLLLGGAGIFISLLASLGPALGAAGQSIISYKQDLARSLHKPLWQRLYLDIILLGLSLYGYYLLRGRGTISFLGQGAALATRVNQILGQRPAQTSGDPFSNPLLFLVPTFFIIALALLFVRLLPLLFDIAGVIRSAPLPFILALRQLGRSRGQYTGPLLLIVLTLGLAGFTASMAKTLDQGLIDNAYYEVGADLRVHEAGESTTETGNDALSATNGAVPGKKEAEYAHFLPIADHLKIAGVQGAARLGSYPAILLIGNREVRGTAIGIDRVDFQKVAFFRRDFSSGVLGDLMNRLAVDDSAALVPASLLKANGLAVGDTLKLEVIVSQDRVEVPLTIAGTTDLFPTVYPEDGTFFVTNLDYLFECMGAEYPHDVLLRTAENSNVSDIIGGLLRLGIDITSAKDARKMIAAERSRPERQGILGLLSIGFIVSALLTTLGYLFYALLSFERRSIELGVLRALGLAQRQAALYLAIEQMILIGAGVIAGTVAGALTSRLFIPFLQVRSGSHPQTPPLVVGIAWNDLASVYVIFGGMFVLALASLIWLLGRMRMASALKMGETM
jgi:putative ABC transport system permease protein